MINVSVDCFMSLVADGFSGSDELAEANPPDSLLVLVHCVQCLHHGKSPHTVYEIYVETFI